MPVNSFENYPMSWKPQKSDLSRPYYLSIAGKLEEDILSGGLAENTKLPPQRELADYLDLNLSTITRAYKLCELKGLLYAVTGSGTFVSPGAGVRDTFLEKGGPAIEMGIIKPFYQQNKSVLDASASVLGRKDAAALFEYSSPLGTKRQLRAAAAWLEYLGIPASSRNVMLAAGAQNALTVALISLFKAGDKIAVDAFTYSNFKGLANLLRIQLVAVGSDSLGLSPKELDSLCRQLDIRGIYLMPTCSNPTGCFLTAERRSELALVIQKYELLVIEDDIYSFLAPAGVPSFLSMLPERTIHICSISKSLCAGLRVAFVVLPRKYREAYTAGMLNINLKTVSLNAEIIAELIESGEAGRMAEQKKVLAERRNKIYYRHFANAGKDLIPRFFHWLPLPDDTSSEAFELSALQSGVHVLGSHRFAVQNRDSCAYIRLSLTSPETEAELEKGLSIVKELLSSRQVTILV